MRKLLLAVALLSISCTNTLCGCSPQPEFVFVRGNLRNSMGEPLAGKRVRVEVASRDCATFFDGGSSRVSGPDGLVVLTVSGTVRDSTCVRLFARDTTIGALESPVGSAFRVRGSYSPWDTVDVPMVLAPAIR